MIPSSSAVRSNSVKSQVAILVTVAICIFSLLHVYQTRPRRSKVSYISDINPAHPYHNRSIPTSATPTPVATPTPGAKSTPIATPIPGAKGDKPTDTPPESTPTPIPSTPSVLRAKVTTCLAEHRVLYDPEKRKQHNGIVLPVQWPPQAYSSPEDLQNPKRVNPVPYYISAPPSVIPINIGRQLFVDPFLIQEMSDNMEVKYHGMKYDIEDNMLVANDNTDFGDLMHVKYKFAQPVWDDVAWIPSENKWRMYYMCGIEPGKTCVATADRSLQKFVRTNVPGTDSNVVKVPVGMRRPTSIVRWYDAPSEDQFWVMFEWHAGNRGQGDEEVIVYTSKSGLGDWKEVQNKGATAGDGNAVFYNPFRKVFVYSLRENMCNKLRSRRYYETPSLTETYTPFFTSFMACRPYKSGEPVYWMGADSNDPPNQTGDRPMAGMYFIQETAYESISFASLGIYTGHPAHRSQHDKEVFIAPGFSRDGFHIYRPKERVPLVSQQENFVYLYSPTSVFSILDDKLVMLVSGRTRDVGGKTETWIKRATMRRDGFASLQPKDLNQAQLITRKLSFCGSFLFINGKATNTDTKFQVEIFNPENPSESVTSDPITASDFDSTKHRISFPGDSDTETALAYFANKPTQFKFHLKSFQLFSFWVTDSLQGHSYGFVAGGGPDFAGNRDVQ